MVRGFLLTNWIQIRSGAREREGGESCWGGLKIKRPAQIEGLYCLTRRQCETPTYAGAKGGLWPFVSCIASELHSNISLGSILYYILEGSLFVKVFAGQDLSPS